ncbi:MAG: survival protein SurE [Deltaproteobacteria bacterium]|nr:survival protein SurE [Deltaproteobacteria bacterium]
MIYSIRRITMWVALGLALALVSCGSNDSSGTGGSGGSAGTGGMGGSADIPLRILVTNDDGFQAEGINAIVEALIADPNNEVVVCAPNGDRSGSGDMTGPSERCGNLDVTTGTTASGYPASAIDGCPADAVNYALDNLYPADEPPDVVLSGINDGQNVGNIGAEGLLSQISGTVGAAKTAARGGVPALASSQGDGDPVDFPAGVAEVLLWLSEHRVALAEGNVSTTNIDSLNIPSCDQGSIRNPLEPLEVPLATENPNGFSLIGSQDCQAEGIDPDTDVNAFFTGWVTLTQVPAN